MKRANFYLGIIALIGLISSCSQHEEMADAGQESKTVTFNVGTDIQIGTRAATDYTIPTGYQLRYMMAVYKPDWTGTTGATINGNPIKRVEVTSTDISASATLSTELEKGTYNIAFFADFIPSDAAPTNGMYEDKWWDTANPYQISVRNQNAPQTLNDQLAWDGFVGTELNVVKGDGEINLSVQLKRPMARINLIATDEDPSAITKAVLTIQPPYLWYLFKNQDTENTQNTVTETIVYSTGINGLSKNSTIMSYFTMCPKAGGVTPKEYTLRIYTDNPANPYNIITIPANIPIKANYITNIKGNFLDKENKNVTYTVTVDPAFDGSDYTGSSTGE